MIRSMTSYARRRIKSNWGSATWEMRSVNHRYLEIHFSLPENFRTLEPIIRERIRYYIVRGKIECNLNFEKNINLQEKLILNEELIKQLINAVNLIKSKGGEGEIDPIDILGWPGVLLAKEENLDIISEEILVSFEEILSDFIISREKEGKILKKLIEQRLENIDSEIVKIRSHMPNIIHWQQKKLLDKLKITKIQFDNNRLEQELIIMTQRMDISEELDRLEAHIKETLNFLNKEIIVGRRLDFIMQEFNRESNTLASKAISPIITNSVIEIKVLIEQMREQIQNIE